MGQPTNIRNVSIISEPGQGKSTLMDALTSKAGIRASSTVSAGDVHPGVNDQDDGKESLPPPQSNMASIYLDLDAYDLGAVQEKQKINGGKLLLNFLDAPGRADFLSDAAAALHITDGAIITVACNAGVCMGTERIVHQAVQEGVRPLLVIDKFEAALLQEVPDKESLYQSFLAIIDDVNLATSTLSPNFLPNSLGDLLVSPEKGTVAFCSSVNGWGFTLDRFAARYSKHLGVDRYRSMTKLWGDNFFNPATKRWSRKPADDGGRPLERAFNMFVLDPIFKIREATMNDSKSGAVSSILTKLDIQLSPEELDLRGIALFNVIMRKFLPINEAVLPMVAIHLPSPLTAQTYRVETLYSGPMDDDSSAAILKCDPAGPLTVYISQMVPTSERGKFYALGRVFSGTASTGSKVCIQGPNHVPGAAHRRYYSGHDLFINKPIKSISLLGCSEGPIEIDSCSPGNIVAFQGIDQFLLHSGTMTTSETAFNIRPPRLSVCPIVQVAVEPENAADLPKLVEALKNLSKSDPGLETTVSDTTGDHVVAGTGESLLETCLKVLRSDLAIDGVELKISSPFTPYRETVKTESRMVATTKSANKHTRIFTKALPLSSKLVEAIENGEVNSQDDFRYRARILSDEYGWDINEARKIWCFGPDITGPNVLVDTTKGVQYLNEIKDSSTAAFQWATKEGVLCEENMRGVRINLLDITLFSDAIHRGGEQIIPAMRRACYAACLLAEPSLQEPILLVEIRCPEDILDNVYHVLNSRGGQLRSEDRGRAIGTPWRTVKAYLPVNNSFQIAKELDSSTNGKAVLNSIFDRWEVMDGSPSVAGGSLEGLISGIRKRKGLKVVSIIRLMKYSMLTLKKRL